MPSELAAALAKVQAELPAVAKGETARIEGRDGRQGYAYTYADLADVSAAILPLLGKHGLAFSTWPTLEDGRFVLSYTLMHESGEERTGIYPLLSQGRQQDIGGAITYARRYCLCAVTGVAPGGEDTDGAGAAEVTMDRPQVSRVPPTGSATGARTRGPRGSAPATVAPDDIDDGTFPEDSPGTATEKQVRGIQMTYRKLGYKPAERDHLLDISEHLIGRELIQNDPVEGKQSRTHGNLSYNEALQLQAALDSTDRAHLEEAVAVPGD